MLLHDILFPSGIPINVFTWQSLNIWQYIQKDRCNKYLAPRLQFTDMHMQSSVSQVSGLTKGILCVMVMCNQQCYVNARFDESKGGIHQVNQLLAGIQRSVECPCSTTANTDSAEDMDQTGLHKMSQHSSVKCDRRCTVAWTAQRSHWTFWISETIFFFCFVSYLVCISYLYIKYAPSNT